MSKRSKIWGLLLLFCLILTFFSTIETYLNYQAQNIETSFWVQLFWSFSNWAPWFLFMPLIYSLTRLILYRWQLYRSIPVMLILGIFITAAKIIIYYIMSLPLRSNITPTFFFTNIGDVIIVNFLGNYLVYCFIVVLSFAVQYYIDTRKKEVRTLQLESQLTKSQLQLLKMQLEPHFLFNTLNSISALIHKDVNLADAMVTKLSDFLRITLDSSDEQEVLLSEEVNFLKNYLDIEKVRFQERLIVHIDIEAIALKVSVPNLILQPLVENAIKYGIAPFSRAGTIRITGRLEDQVLVLKVSDDGPGLLADPEEVLQKGIGLKNTKERLEQLYGEKQKFELINRTQGGLLVRLEIPTKTIATDKEKEIATV
ncbi:hypothetical protein GF406_17285 [candidate division KSB1 bacterium]|nr:hypothetical protein [candidate division KSB1 bacterium]